ncbi:MAG: ceramidase domain-containing protein [Pseudomonadota bacterium]
MEGAGLFRRIDAYCERTDISLLAEPLNAITNLAFIIAALMCWRRAVEMERTDWTVIFLTINLFVIGVGSTLFHTFAQVWAALTDTIPIMIFILGYFAVAMNRFVGLTWLRVGGAMVVFLIALFVTSFLLNWLLRPVIGGTVSYFPALLAIIAVGAWLHRAGHPAGLGLFAAAGFFIPSLTMRALDQPMCSTLPFGTHFGWHIFNALVLGTLIMTLIRHGRVPEGPSSTAQPA